MKINKKVDWAVCGYTKKPCVKKFQAKFLEILQASFIIIYKSLDYYKNCSGNSLAIFRTILGKLLHLSENFSSNPV